MGRAIVVACAVLLGVAACGEAPEDSAEAVVQSDAPPTSVTEERETTTTRPSTTTTTTSTTTTTTTTTTTAPPTTTTAPPPPPPPPPPTTTAPPPPPTTAAPVQASGGGCDPNYTPCVPVASDVDCAGGSGNGPAYVAGPVTVVGTDIYDLDRDGDGIGCDS